MSMCVDFINHHLLLNSSAFLYSSISFSILFSQFSSTLTNMQGVSLARFIVGILGNVVSAFLFLSPVPTFYRILKNKSTEEFHPYPYLAAMMNCMLWVFYGLPVVHPDSTLVYTINSFGLLMEVIYLIIFFIHTSKKSYRKTILMFIAGELALLAVVVVVALLALHTHEMRSMIVGIISDIFGIIMYASPLSNMKQVIRTKSTEYMPFWLCVVGFTNGVIWFTYAFLKTIDPYIAFGNGLGALCGVVQLSVFAYYTCTSKEEQER